MRRPTWGQLAKGGLTLTLALLAAELFLRLTTQRETVFQTWYTPGVHTPDPRYGFIYTPHFRGYMRHKDHVWNVPVELDEHGFRSAFAPSPQAERPETVVLVGGASMMMCYGLPDDQTIGSRLRQHLGQDVDVRSVAWGGFDLFRSWHLYRDKLADTVSISRLVLCVYGETPEYFAQLPTNWDELPPPPPPEQLFGLVPGVVTRPRGPVSEFFGSIYYESPILHALARIADQPAAQLCGDWTSHSRRELSPSAPRPSVQGSVAQSSATQQSVARASAAQGASGIARFQSFIEYAQAFAHARGTEVLVAFLPMRADYEHFAPLRSALEGRCTAVDLHQELASMIAPENFVAQGHYGPGLAARIADALAEQLTDHTGSTQIARTDRSSTAR